MLQDGTIAPLLRTWMEPKFEDAVEYDYISKDCLIRTWNVYEVKLPNGQVVEEMWTENAGLWVEQVGPLDRICHCSQGMLDKPDFECLIYRLSIKHGT